MFHEVFYWVLNMSVLGTAFGLCLYALRLIKNFPKFGRYLLWGVVFLRLICPIGFTSRYSLLSLLSKTFSKVFVKTVIVRGEGSIVLPQLAFTNTIQAAVMYEPIIYKTNSLKVFFHVTSMIWVIITAILLIAFVVMYGMAKAELKKARPLGDNLYEGEMVRTPTVYGIIKPKIIIPVGCVVEHMELVINHEKTHIRRMDNLWRIIALLIACIHWFNPAIWMFLKSFYGDCELACDTKVIKNMKPEERKRYAKALLHHSTVGHFVFASPFSNTGMKNRITNILSYRKLTLISSVSFILMCFIIVVLVLTNSAS